MGHRGLPVYFTFLKKSETGDKMLGKPQFGLEAEKVSRDND